MEREGYFSQVSKVLLQKLMFLLKQTWKERKKERKIENIMYCVTRSRTDKFDLTVFTIWTTNTFKIESFNYLSIVRK